MGPHRRFNPLNGEWVLVSPHRTQRPWLGQVEPPAEEDRPLHDPACYLCPGNVRAGGAKNPDYTSTFVFHNDFAALLPESTEVLSNGPFQSQAVKGECRVMCFSPRHDKTLAEMSTLEIEQVVTAWIGQYKELGGRYTWVQAFENKGQAMGCSNPHPHGQIWAGDWVPSLIERENECQREWKRGNLILDCLEGELKDGSRIVEQNEDWVLWVPFWAVWPFEYLLAPRRQVSRMTELSDRERVTLASILRAGLIRYDNLFETTFPYSMGWHCAPFKDGDWSHWQLHAHFFPPLLRSATVKKFMVGYEMLAEPQRDITAEHAADRLRSVGAQHYRLR